MCVRRHSAWACMFHREYFQIKDKRDQKKKKVLKVDLGFCLLACLFVLFSTAGDWETKSKLLVDHLEGTGGDHRTWQSWMQAGGFLCSLFRLLSICAWISLLFFAIELLLSLCEFMVSWETCVDLCLKKTSETHWFFSVFIGLSLHTRAVFQQPCFQMQFQILHFSFHGFRWYGFLAVWYPYKSGVAHWCLWW